MGWQAFTHFFWGVDGYPPTRLLNNDRLSSAVNHGWRSGPTVDEVQIATPCGDDAPWLGATAGTTLPGKHPGGDWARMRGEDEPRATPEFAARFARTFPEAVVIARRHWERIRAVLVAHGFPDPGEGALLARSDYD